MVVGGLLASARPRLRTTGCQGGSHNREDPNGGFLKGGGPPDQAPFKELQGKHTASVQGETMQSEIPLNEPPLGSLRIPRAPPRPQAHTSNDRVLADVLHLDAVPWRSIITAAVFVPKMFVLKITESRLRTNTSKWCVPLGTIYSFKIRPDSQFIFLESSVGKRTYMLEYTYYRVVSVFHSTPVR